MRKFFETSSRHRAMVDMCAKDDILWSSPEDGGNCVFPHAAWARFATLRLGDPLYRYNSLLYLTNCNAVPFTEDGYPVEILPVWHAAVVAFRGNVPCRFMLIDEPATLQTLRQRGDVKDILQLEPLVAPQVETVECDLGEAPLPPMIAPGQTVACSQGFYDEERRQNAELMRRHAEQIGACALSIFYMLNTPVMTFKLNFYASMTNPEGTTIHLIQHNEVINSPI